MKNSKKKTPQSKLQRIKSSENLSRNKPIGSLLSEINNLKQQLRDIKRLKKEDPILKSLNSPKSKMSNQEQQQLKKYFEKEESISKENTFNKTQPKIICYTQKQSENQIQIQNLASFSQTKNRTITKQTKKQKQTEVFNMQNIDQTNKSSVNLMQIYYKQKDKKLKMDIQINKVKKIIHKIQGYQLVQPLNTIFELVTTSNQDFIKKIQFLQQTQVTQQQIIQIQIQKQQHSQVKKKLFQIQEANKRMKKQIAQINSNLIKANDQSQSKQTQIFKLRNRLSQLSNIVNDLQSKNIQLQQQNRIYQVKIHQKQQQLIFSLEDVNYLRMQTQNFKQKKKELQELYNQLEKQFKEYKKLKTIEIDKLQIEKCKFEKQCKLRRSQSEQIQSFQSQRNALTKQIQQLRILYDVKTEQYQIKKKQLNQLRQKNILLEADAYKIKCQNKKLNNQKDFYQYEVDQLNNQLKQLRQVKLYKNRINRSASKQIKHQVNVSEIANIPKKVQRISSLQKSRKKQTINECKSYVPLEQRENKLRALDQIHLLIKKHKEEIQI